MTDRKLTMTRKMIEDLQVGDLVAIHTPYGAYPYEIGTVQEITQTRIRVDRYEYSRRTLQQVGKPNLSHKLALAPDYFTPGLMTIEEAEAANAERESEWRAEKLADKILSLSRFSLANLGEEKLKEIAGLLGLEIEPA